MSVTCVYQSECGFNDFFVNVGPDPAGTTSECDHLREKSLSSMFVTGAGSVEQQVVHVPHSKKVPGSIPGSDRGLSV